MTDQLPISAQFDTNVVNRLADNPEWLEIVLGACESGLLRVFQTVETKNEVLNCWNPARMTALLQALQKMPPLEPTRHSRLGAVALGQGRVVLPSDEQRESDLSFLRDPADRLLAANAGGNRCDYFVTDDREMKETKRARVEAVIECAVIGVYDFCVLLRERLQRRAGSLNDASPPSA